jgi:peptidoglycan/LPS O-acetylase OafA/YrhL
MMLLGVALHSATAYSTFPDVWWLKDPHTSRWADLFILWVHTFRLPLFFVMSGFFAALLFEKRGAGGFLRNRAARLLLPFLLGLAAMFPFLKLASVYAWFLARSPEPWRRLEAWVAEGRLWRSLEPMHLWFLIVLMMLCAAALLAESALRRAMAGAWFARLLERRGGWLVWAGATMATLLPMQFGILDTPGSFLPQARVLAAYAVFFAFGWGLYLHRGQLGQLRRFGAGAVLAGALCALMAAGAVERQMAALPARTEPAHAGTALFTALGCWLTLLGLAGIALRRLDGGSPVWRYLSDSAYWVFLFHPPVLVAVQLPMMRLGWPAEVKIVAGLAFAVPVLYFLYDSWVRPGWLGALLNGCRMPRGLPRQESCGADAPAAAEPCGAQ